VTSPTLDGPCSPWDVDPTCLPNGWDPGTEAHEAVIEIASDTLWRLTAGVYGLCEVTVRPCRKACMGVNVFAPIISSGVWLNIGCVGGCRGACGCGPVCELRLPGPVNSIVEVVVDGDVVPADTYRVDNAQWLVREGPDCWPACQDLASSLTEPNTWAVTYVRGVPVPLGGQRAVGKLAVELDKACTGASGCRLPSRVIEVAREGITYQLSEDDLPPDISSWVSSVNPYGARSLSRVYSPDVPQVRRTTWP